MSKPKPLSNRPSQGALRALASLCLVTCAALAQQSTNDMFKPVTALPGGLSPQPTITQIKKTTNGVTVTWSAFLKPFVLQQTDELGSGVWQTLLTTSESEGSTTIEGELGVLRVGSPTPIFYGSDVCGACHDDAHANWAGTPHATALQSLKNIGMDKSPSCLPCHTVGYGLPTGYRDEASTPQLANVQCENCHGPSGQHIANIDDPSMRPVVTIAAESCGGCHTDAHHPTYDEWQEAGHAQVSEAGMFNAGVGRMYQCGTCHSGAVRQAVVLAYDNGETDVVSPTINDANTYGQVCTTCHDPHMSFTNVLLSATGEPLIDEAGQQILAKPAQLRNPIGSAKFMSYLTSTNPTSFAGQYDPDIQLCGQCHNERGAAWNGTGRPPHHSPQYNILIGQVADPAVDTNHFNGLPAGHGDPKVARPYGNPYQCTACHNRAEEEASPTPSNPNYTGHKFEVQLLACADCHGFLDEDNAEEVAEGGIEFIQAGTHSGMNKTMAALNNWAATKIPGLDTPGSTNYVLFYGTNAPSTVVPWEFGTIGQLNTGKKSPGTPAQNKMLKYTPQILQARFLLYMVEHDASYGVHNPTYVRQILKKAEDLANNAPAVPAN